MQDDALLAEIRELKTTLGKMLWSLGACTILGRIVNPASPEGLQLCRAALTQFSLMMELIEQDYGESGDPSKELPKWLQ